MTREELTEQQSLAAKYAGQATIKPINQLEASMRQLLTCPALTAEARHLIEGAIACQTQEKTFEQVLGQLFP